MFDNAAADAMLFDSELLELSGMQKIPTCFVDLIDCPMVLPISTSEFDAKNTPDPFKHVPDLF